MGAIREGFVHARSVEIPDWRAIHDPQAVGTENAKVQSGVCLFHESVLFRARVQLEPARKGPKNALHDELAREGKNDNVKGDEREVLSPFAIVGGGCWISADVGRDQRV